MVFIELYNLIGLIFKLVKDNSSNDYLQLILINGKDNLFNPSGKRKYRGLYKTKSDLLINADINGSLNIMRKYLKCNSDEILSPTDVGFVVNPVKVKFI